MLQSRKVSGYIPAEIYSVSNRNLEERNFGLRHAMMNVSCYCSLRPGFELHMPKVNSNPKTKLHDLSPRANYTDRATAACRRSDCQLLRIESATWSAWRIPMGVFSVSRQEPLLFYQVAPELYSWGWVDPVPDPLPFFCSSAGNRTRASGSVAKNSDH
jgi:hypothetical protein